DRGEVVECQCGREQTVEEVGSELELGEKMGEMVGEGAGGGGVDVLGRSFLVGIKGIGKGGEEDVGIE
ncbi:hypothetical protein, partial [Micrococcus luteus]|uniref:hypothetical protein n=1 Tax=Micrococcus luteus TaxID=1270 RepID=UPI001C92ED4B